MTKVKLVDKCKHPNSRNTKNLARQLKRQQLKGKLKVTGSVKHNLLGEKLQWFQNNIDTTLKNYTPTHVGELIQKYLWRFDAELEQIKLKQSIGQRKYRQHANREDVINLTLRREKEEYNSCGIEIPDLLDSAQLHLLKKWNGELRFLQNFTLKRFSERSLEEMSRKRANQLGKNMKNQDTAVRELNAIKSTGGTVKVNNEDSNMDVGD